MAELDRKILDVARRLFKENGIMNTEMKDIAREVGCSKSTLYRHFNGKEAVVFVLANESLERLGRYWEIPPEMRFSSGYEALQYQLQNVITGYVMSKDDVTFVRDFDAMFSSKYPDIPQAHEFEMKYSGDRQKKAGINRLVHVLERGIQDNSIEIDGDLNLVSLVINQGCLALAERIIPREEHYINGWGVGQEIIRKQADLWLKALKRHL